jgi:endonuclease G
MRKKALSGGAIALIVIIAIGIFCYWIGKKTYDYIKGTDSTTVNKPDDKPDGKPRVPPVQPANDAEAQRIYLMFGNPSNAGTSDTNNYLLVNNFFALSYSRDRAIPNWVAWRVTKADMSDLQRQDSFRPDDRLPSDWKHVTPTDYVGSGYDKGHVCPNADRDGSPESMASTFLMTNMTPQTPDLNRGPWEKLEAYLRTLVKRGSDVYIIAGVYGDQGKIKKKITIPTNSWKIAVAVPAGSDISAVNDNTRVIAVDMPNVKGIKNADWQVYRTTVRDIEKQTGYKFFSNLPQNLQNSLGNKKDTIND